MSEGCRERATAEHVTRYHFPLFLFRVNCTILSMMRHDMGWKIPEQGDCSLSRLVGLGWTWEAGWPVPDTYI